MGRLFGECRARRAAQAHSARRHLHAKHLVEHRELAVGQPMAGELASFVLTALDVEPVDRVADHERRGPEQVDPVGRDHRGEHRRRQERRGHGTEAAQFHPRRLALSRQLRASSAVAGVTMPAATQSSHAVPAGTS